LHLPGLSPTASLLFPFAATLIFKSSDVLRYLWDSCPHFWHLCTFDSTLLGSLQLLLSFSATGATTSKDDTQHLDDIILFLMRSPTTHQLFRSLPAAQRHSAISKILSDP
jgi:hypothetical protein